MTERHYFVHINDCIHAVLNYEQQSDGSCAFVLTPIINGRLDIYIKLKEKKWKDDAIHERLFPRSRLEGKWTPLCKDNHEHLYIQDYLSWSSEELITAIRQLMRAELRSLDALSKHDLAICLRYLKDQEDFQQSA